MLSVYVCLLLSLQSWPHAHFVSQHQCALSSLSSVLHTRVCWGANTGHSLLAFALLCCFPFLFFYRTFVVYVWHLSMIEYDPEYDNRPLVLLMYCTSISCKTGNKSCVCMTWAMVVSSSSFHVLLCSQRGSNLWCYCFIPFQCNDHLKTLTAMTV